MKRWTRFLLVVCMVLLLPAVSVAARAADASGACGDNLTWTFDEEAGTLTISGTGPMWDWGYPNYTPWHSHRPTIKSIAIGDSVTSIGDYAFYDCDNLTEVAIPNSVTAIGKTAFSYCTSLTQVTIGDSVTTIGVQAFDSCDSLTQVTIPASVTSIGSMAFYSCDSLTQVTIPNSVTSIGFGTFSGCMGLTSITVTENNTQYCSVDGVLFNNTQTALLQYPAGKETKKYIIPNSVTSISCWAFFGCDKLTEVTIPNGVTYIDEWTFACCDNLTEVTIPNGVTYIGHYAFYQCDNLVAVTIPDGVTYIRAGAFGFCTSLTEIAIPNSITAIEDDAFFNCDSLTEVTIPNSVTSIGDRAFADCALSDIIIPNSVTYIGKQAFDVSNNVYYLGTEAQWDAIDIENDNDSLLNATIHYAFDPKTGAVFIPPLPEGAESALIAAYGDGKLICAVTGQVGNDNYIPLADQPDEIRIFYLYENYQPVTGPDIIQLD